MRPRIVKGKYAPKKAFAAIPEDRRCSCWTRKPMEDVLGIIGECADIRVILHPICDFRAAE